MSNNTINPLDHVTASLQDKSDDEQVKITVFPPLPKQKHHLADNTPKTLHRFREFPNELQLKIFKEALPDPRVILFDFIIVVSVVDAVRDFERGLFCYAKVYTRFDLPTPNSKGSLSLVSTCKASEASVYLGGYEKIKICPPRSSTAMLTNPKYVASTHVRNECLCEGKLDYKYMRPVQDIIMLEDRSLIDLFKHGGSLNLDKFTHIAVFGYVVDSGPRRHGLYSHLELIELFEVIELLCPNLKRLSLVLCNASTNDTFHRIFKDEPSDCMKLLEINANLNKLDLWDFSRNRVSQAYPVSTVERNYLPEILNRGFYVEFMIGKHIDAMERKGNAGGVSYWKKVETVPVLPCFLMRGHGRTQLSIPELCSTVYFNDDGSLKTV